MQHLPALLSLITLASACAATAPPVRPAPTSVVTGTSTGPVATPVRNHLVVGDQVEIVDDGQLYSTINVTDCLTWPSQTHKARGGQGAWRDYYPKNGDVGTVLGLSQHCDAPEIQVAILDIRGHVVAIGVPGLRFEGGRAIVADGNTVASKPPEGLGNFGNGLGMGGGGGGPSSGGGTSAGGVFAVGDTVTVVDDGQLYSTINATDCLTWPSADLKQRGGQDSWGSFYPAKGSVGTVLATSAHCSGGGVIVAILDIQGYVVAIGESGLARGGAGGAAAAFRVGETVKISDAGQLFSKINESDCLTWPSAEIKAAGGAASWVGYYPGNGDVGTVLGSSPHCDQAGVMVVFISVGKHYVAIGSTGLSR